MVKPKLTSFLKPFWMCCLLSPLFMVGEVLVDLWQPKLMSSIVDDGVLGQNMNIIIRFGLLMLFLSVLGGIAGIASAGFASVASQGFGNSIRNAAFSKVMSLSLQQTDKFTTGSLITRLTNDITAVQMFVSLSIRMFVRVLMQFVGGIFMALTLNINFGLVLIVSMPVQLIFLFILLRKANPLFTIVQGKLDRVNSVVQENITGARVVKAYVREEYEINRFDNASSDYMRTNLRVQKLFAILNPILMIIMNCSVLAIIFIGGLQVEASAMKVGEVMATITYVTQILMSVMMIGNIFQMVSRAKASSDRIKEVLAADPEIVSGQLCTDKRGAGSVEFKNVTFQYPDASGDPVLSGIDFRVEPGETVAVLGSTGSGKTSLVNLISRFYDVSDGQVLVDGVDVREYDLTALREKIGFVLQKSELFSGTIADNIRWGDENASDEEVERAASIAQADEYINTFVNGYNTIVGEKGASLSGGQKQRLAIARAIIKKPEILIFDDSTSALDLGTEARLQKALRENLRGVTVVMIAQRVASVKNCDKIAVLENGRVVGFAPHDELLKNCKVYQDIVESQIKQGGDIDG